MSPTLTYLLPVDWLGLPQRFHAMARGLVAQGWRVRVLCPRPHGPLLAARDWRALTSAWSELHEGESLVVRRVPTWPGYRRSPGGIRWQWAQGWRLMAHAARAWGPSEVLMLADPSLAPLAEALPHRLLVYEAADAWPDFWPEAVAGALRQRELALASRAGLVVATTPLLAEALGRPDALILPNGVDLEAFSPPLPEAPEPLRAWMGKAPCVGFMGHLGAWVDLPRVRRLAERLPHGRFLLVGPSEGQDAGWATLPNVWREGWVAPEARAAWLSACPLWWIPFDDGPVAQAADPLKALEALAAGRRLLAPPLPALAEWAGAFLPLAGEDEAWIAALEGAWALGLPTPAERQLWEARLKARAWPALVGRLDLALREALGRPASMGMEAVMRTGQGV